MPDQKVQKVVTAHIPMALAEKVDELALQLKRSRGWIVKQALSAWVAEEKTRHKLTLEALADVDKGRSVGHQAVQAWADSLGSRKTAGSPVPKNETEIDGWRRL